MTGNELWGMAFPEPYMTLFNASVSAVKSVNPQYKVGGPATAQLNGYLGGTVAFANESQQRGVPFDFVSTHFYPSSGVRTSFRPCAGGNDWDPECFAQQMRQTKDAIPKGTPLYLTEYNAGCCIGYFQHDTAGAAAFAFRSVAEMDGVLDVMSWWTFSDVSIFVLSMERGPVLDSDMERTLAEDRCLKRLLCQRQSSQTSTVR